MIIAAYNSSNIFIIFHLKYIAVISINSFTNCVTQNILRGTFCDPTPKPQQGRLMLVTYQ
jgi:hypothetical protein